MNFKEFKLLQYKILLSKSTTIKFIKEQIKHPRQLRF